VPGLPLRGITTVRTPNSCRLSSTFLAVAAVGGDRARQAPTTVDDPLDGGSQLWCVGGVARLHGVIQHGATHHC
jgi:hypothetical protein